MAVWVYKGLQQKKKNLCENVGKCSLKTVWSKCRAKLKRAILKSSVITCLIKVNDTDTLYLGIGIVQLYIAPKLWPAVSNVPDAKRTLCCKVRHVASKCLISLGAFFCCCVAHKTIKGHLVTESKWHHRVVNAVMLYSLLPCAANTAKLSQFHYRRFVVKRTTCMECRYMVQMNST